MSYLYMKCVHACTCVHIEVTFCLYKNLVLRAARNEGEFSVAVFCVVNCAWTHCTAWNASFSLL